MENCTEKVDAAENSNHSTIQAHPNLITLLVLHW